MPLPVLIIVRVKKLLCRNFMPYVLDKGTDCLPVPWKETQVVRFYSFLRVRFIVNIQDNLQLQNNGCDCGIFVIIARNNNYKNQRNRLPVFCCVVRSKIHLQLRNSIYAG